MPSQKTKVFGWNITTIINTSTKAPSGPSGKVVLSQSPLTQAQLAKHLGKALSPWQKTQLKSAEPGKVLYFDQSKNPVLYLQLPKTKAETQNFGWTAASSYQDARHQAGALLTAMEAQPIKTWKLLNNDLTTPALKGLLVGLSLADYRYRKAADSKASKTHLQLSGLDKALVKEAQQIGEAVNLARHLVNTPPNILQPTSYSSAIKDLFGQAPHTEVTIWDKKQLQKQNCGLILAVGRAATHGPAIVRIRYRPKAASNQPLAFLGKGITFDSGGLDLKPATAMRLMKKDMGGAATITGLAHWLVYSKAPINADFYLALAENAVSAEAYRPGDVLTSRSGKTVEIHNTDAEGRLALADALDIASTAPKKHQPQLMIDAATLTGAARVGVGTGLAALLSTSSPLATALLQAGQEMGDPAWPLPLMESYASGMKTAFADLNHCASSGYGGAITAALFLKNFTTKIPWAHLDMMGWSEAQGAQRETGGNGQMVQCLIGFCQKFIEKGSLKL